MLKFKRIIGALLVLVLFASSLASCQKKTESNVNTIENADKALENTAYSMDVSLEYSSEDAKMIEAIESFSMPTMKILVDGDKFQGKMDLVLDGVNNYITYTYVDGVLYTEWREYDKTVQNSKELGDTDKTALTESYGAGASINSDDFEKVTVNKTDTSSVITCETIKDDALMALVNSLNSEFRSLNFNGSAALKNAKLVIEIQDGKYSSTTLTCLYYITTALDTYTIEMTYSCNFGYDVEFEITAPDFD
jgi:hypothetical protein